MTHQTQCQISRFLFHFQLAQDADEFAFARAWLEKIVHEAALDAAMETSAVCRLAAFDLLDKERSRFYERLREVSSC